MARITIASLKAELAAADSLAVEQGRTIEKLRAQVAMLKPVDGGKQRQLGASDHYPTTDRLNMQTRANAVPPMDNEAQILPKIVYLHGEPHYKIKTGWNTYTFRPTYRGVGSAA